MYEKANESANKLTKYIYVALVQITIPSIFLIQFFISFFVYFTTDLGENSFRLPFPIEWVIAYFQTMHKSEPMIFVVLSKGIRLV